MPNVLLDTATVQIDQSNCYVLVRMRAQETKMAAAVVDGKNLSSVLSPGSELSCTTTHGDTLRGNVVATDDQKKVVVISILL